MKLKPSNKVKTVENHNYLSISKRHVGVVIKAHYGGDAEVKFKHKPRPILFSRGELKKIK